MATLEELIGRNNSDEIAITGQGNEKIEFLENNLDLVQQLIEMGFTGTHVYEVVRGSEWKEKFEKINQDYEGVWKPLGFTPSHIAKIVNGKNWEQKLLWIEMNFEQSSYTPASVARTMQKKDWAERLVYRATALA